MCVEIEALKLKSWGMLYILGFAYMSLQETHAFQ